MKKLFNSDFINVSGFAKKTYPVGTNLNEKFTTSLLEANLV